MQDLPTEDSADQSLAATHNQLAGLLGRAGLEDILAALDSTLATDPPALLRAVASRDGDAVSRVAHRMKGGFASLGALRLVALLERLEVAGRADDWSLIDSNLPAAAYELDRVRSVIDRTWR